MRESEEQEAVLNDAIDSEQQQAAIITCRRTSSI
jgi:hypothetical protein